HVMLEVIEKCFPNEMKQWEAKIKEMIPSYGVSLMKNETLLRDIQTLAAQTLGLKESMPFQI
ncbi:malate:quinone oxidoreductase, partial [Bhargavaea massiliensis]